METTKQSRDPPSQDRLDPSGKNASAALHASAARAEAALAWRAPGLFGSFHRSNPKSEKSRNSDENCNIANGTLLLALRSPYLLTYSLLLTYDPPHTKK